jgi:hypothetical protein
MRVQDTNGARYNTKLTAMTDWIAMTGTDWVAITGIVVSGVLGPIVGFAAAHFQYRTARQAEREDELLHVLDDVVLYVNRGRRALETTAEVARQGIAANDAEFRAAWAVYAADTLPPMRAGFQKVFVRLGRVGPIPEAIEQMRHEFFALRAPLDRYRAGEPWSNALDIAFDNALKEFMIQQDLLYDAVHGKVGLQNGSNRATIGRRRKRL